MAFAVAKTKLSDFGDDTSPNFRDSYRVIMDSNEYKNQKFTNIGYIFAQNEMNLTFSRRLRFVHYLKENAAVLTMKVPTPVFVIGLPRTGYVQYTSSHLLQ
jgi:hypothetical protein